MATLKGQNVRLFVNRQVVGMATTCTITLTGNTEDASTKDDVGMASKPTITSKSWSASVESLSMVDAALLLQIIKTNTPVELIWDETATSDNKTEQHAAYSRMGRAYLNDISLNFNDRENSAKSLQLAGIGAITKIETWHSTAPMAGSYTKGQFVRLFVGSDNSAVPAKVIAAAKQLTFHVSVSLEDATTKDTSGDWQIQEPTGISWDISTNALVRSGEEITSDVEAQGFAELEEIYEAGLPVKFQISNVSGDNQRTKGTVIVSGSVVLTQLQLNGPNRQNADYSAQFNGYGEYV